MCSKKKVFLEISQNSQENTRARVSILIKLQAWGLQETLHRCFPVSFAKFLKIHFLTEHLRWLLLRGPDFVSVPQLFTIQRTSNSLAKAHLKIPFLQSSSQWLPSNVIYFVFKKGKNKKQFFIPPLTLTCLKSCNSIKIKILFIHDSEKTTRIYLPFFSIKSTLCLLFTFMLTFFFKMFTFSFFGNW